MGLYGSAYVFVARDFCIFLGERKIALKFLLFLQSADQYFEFCHIGNTIKTIKNHKPLWYQNSIGYNNYLRSFQAGAAF